MNSGRKWHEPMPEEIWGPVEDPQIRWWRLLRRLAGGVWRRMKRRLGLTGRGKQM